MNPLLEEAGYVLIDNCDLMGLVIDRIQQLQSGLTL